MNQAHRGRPVEYVELYHPARRAAPDPSRTGRPPRRTTARRASSSPKLAVVDLLHRQSQAGCPDGPKACQEIPRPILRSNQPEHAKARVSRVRARWSSWAVRWRPRRTTHGRSRPTAKRHRPDPAFYIERAQGAGRCRRGVCRQRRCRGLDAGTRASGPAGHAAALRDRAGDRTRSARRRALTPGADRRTGRRARKPGSCAAEKSSRTPAGREEARAAYTEPRSAPIASRYRPSRRGNRAMHRLHAQAETAIARLKSD